MVIWSWAKLWRTLGLCLDSLLPVLCSTEKQGRKTITSRYEPDARAPMLMITYIKSNYEQESNDSIFMISAGSPGLWGFLDPVGCSHRTHHNSEVEDLDLLGSVTDRKVGRNMHWQWFPNSKVCPNRLSLPRAKVLKIVLDLANFRLCIVACPSAQMPVG